MLAGYEPVIGLEVHAPAADAHQDLLRLRATASAQPPNTLRLPGLPRRCPARCPCPRAQAVTLALRAALALGCTVNEVSVFARKNYFYPDLPKGYQISQYDAAAGRATARSRSPSADGAPRAIRITRVHMEEDAGKLLHEGFAWSAEKSGVDFNRAGVPLIEIVTEPDLRSRRGGRTST